VIKFTDGNLHAGQQMTEADLACLKSRIDQTVEIQTVSGEQLIARVIWVFDGEDNPDLFYDLVSTSNPESYPRLSEACGYALPLKEIVSVKPLA
jgi:hypothetical protein